MLIIITTYIKITKLLRLCFHTLQQILYNYILSTLRIT